MAVKKKNADMYVNRAYASLVLSAANTQTFEQIRWATGLFSGIALKLVEVQYHLTYGTLADLVADGDKLAFGICSRNDLESMDPEDQSVYDAHFIDCPGVNVEPFHSPIVKSFANLSQGGLLIPANPLYVGANSFGFASAAGINVVIFYQFVQLSPQESLEVLQTIIPGNV